MKAPSSNLIVKVAVPMVLASAMVIGVKSCSNDRAPTTGSQTDTHTALKDLSPEDLKAMGVEGDTPQDTLRTVVGNFRKVQDRLDSLADDNKKLSDENKALKTAGSNVDMQISQVVGNVRVEEAQKRQQLSAQVTDLGTQVKQLMEQLQSGNTGINTGGKHDGPSSDIPIGLGYDNGMNTGAVSTPSSDGLQWVEPKDGIAVDASGRAVTESNKNNATGFSFASSFSDSSDAGKQATGKAVVTAQTSLTDAQKKSDPVYTLPENSTLVGSRAMTALLGRIPIDGKVTDPYPFKVMIGRDNLTANGIELPDVQGAIVSGTATGDWTLSCVRGAITSITFVFIDGTVRTLPSPDGQNSAGNQSSGNSNGNNSSIGWLSDDNGIPCISGTRKSNASTYLPTISMLSAASAAGDGITANQSSTQSNGYGGVTSTLTGDAGQAVLGKALSGGMRETTDWVKARYGQTFDAIYVPPGKTVALHITRQLAIDYEEQGRKVKYDFSLAGSGTGMD
ncbi:MULTISPECIES: TIGR03752 family integrating conjugative element protein [Lonsdalea]|uniref:Conjugal transfer protein TrbI n=1 Tax=Lonsdalea quercina TaxID=71657 RepID=A0ACD1JCT8_9GAMM|nr:MULTISPECIES: TIGR03752 family integrating conjugative element protein [Lonsdalea]RAT12194.1 conjugal transfer protein TrbI [Lonsdalea quercina]RAT17839.1 conjugal transfer protein TrbI [Lonsdalea populi]RAT21738.1 conjugal transfer protein TrbI [Lonsdalea populi]RAT23673.1 conjugal transfer protein TrbI [Lonsdalea populi]RAT62796.1 conjugal transfer protein TrbI [Lonsdalea populi]